MTVSPTPLAKQGVPNIPAARLGFTGTDLILLLMAVIWGVNISVVKYGVGVVAPTVYNAIRVSLAAATLLAIVLAFVPRWPATRDVVRLLALGALGNGLYQILFITGVSRTSAGNAALVLAATPALIAVLGRIGRTEKVTGKTVLGMVLSILGVALVIGTGAFTTTTADIGGDLLVLAACLCWATFTVLLKPYTERINTLQIAALTMCGGLPVLVLAALPAIPSTSWSSIPASVWYSILFSGIGALVLAYLFWYRGIRVLGPTRTAMYANLQPAVAIAGAWLLLREVPTPLQGVGALGIISGLLLARS